MPKRIFINNQIRAGKVRLVDENGKQLGIFDLNQALEKAKEKGLDLIKVTEHVEPPVCKLLDYGKFIYYQKKRERQQKAKRGGEVKNIRLTFNISEHDLETRVKSAEKFLNKGYRARIEMRLRGREKSLLHFAKQKMKRFLELLNQSLPLKTERELKEEGRGLTIVIAKAI